MTFNGVPGAAEYRARLLADLGISDLGQSITDLIVAHQRTILNKQGLGARPLTNVCNSPYGAKGDGSTDDTTAIHAARDAAAAFGADLYFPKGTYKNTGLIASVSGQRWILDPGATILRPTGQNIHGIQITASDVTISGGSVDMTTSEITYSPVFIASGLTRVIVEEMYINGGSYGVRVKGGTGPVTTNVIIRQNRIENCQNHGVIFNWEVTDSEISDNVINAIGAGGNGVWVGNSSTGCRILRNRITSLDMGIEVVLSSANPTVAGNTITSGFYGISISASIRGLVNDNRVTTTGTNAHGIELADSAHSSVSDNHILNVTGNGVSIASNIANGNDYVTVKDNHIITPTGQAINSAGSGTASHVMVIGNTIQDPGTAVAAIQNDIDDNHWSVLNNEIVRTATGPGAGSGINMGGVGNTVAGNTIYHDAGIAASAGDAIRFACDDSIAAGNNVIGNGKVARAFLITSTHVGNAIVGNRMSGTTADALRCDNVGSTNVLTGNHLVNVTSGTGITYNGASGVNYQGVSGRLEAQGPFRFNSNIGFFSTTPIAKRTGTPADATDLATAITLVNALKTHLVTYGLIS